MKNGYFTWFYGAINICLALSIVVRIVQAQSFQQQTVTLQYDSPELTYFPLLCSGTAFDCAGAWFTDNLTDNEYYYYDTNETVVSTTGPNAQFGDLLPQLFFEFRGQMIFIQTSFTSNATANVTVVMSPSGTAINQTFLAYDWEWVIQDLNDSESGLASITFVPSVNTTRLDIESIVIFGANATVNSSLLPTQSLPPTNSPASLPTSTFNNTSTQSSVSSPQVRQIVVIDSIFAAFFVMLSTIGIVLL